MWNKSKPKEQTVCALVNLFIVGQNTNMVFQPEKIKFITNVKIGLTGN